MRDLLKKTAYMGIGLAATASDSVKEAYAKMIEQADATAKEGEQIIEHVMELKDFQLPDNFMLNEEEIIANIQYNS